jgi:hypothetical protein
LCTTTSSPTTLINKMNNTFMKSDLSPSKDYHYELNKSLTCTALNESSFYIFNIKTVPWLFWKFSRAFRN